MTIREDGIGIIRVRASIATEDGAMLSADYSGVLDFGHDGYKRALAGDFPPLPTIQLAPRFITGSQKYLWLNRLECVGVGQVRMSDLTVQYDLFGIRNANRPDV